MGVMFFLDPIYLGNSGRGLAQIAGGRTNPYISSLLDDCSHAANASYQCTGCFVPTLNEGGRLALARASLMAYVREIPMVSCK